GILVEAVRGSRRKLFLEPGKRYLVNPGSVGQPRDRNPRASYAIYDSEERTVTFDRVPYDVKTTRRKILKAGLPPILGDRLLLGDRGGDFDACVADLRCEEEAVAWTWFDEEDGRHWYQVATTFILACAPDWSLLTLVLHEPQADGGRPRAFDHAAWSYMCIPSWDPSIDDANFTCFSGEGGPRLGDGVGEGVIGRVRQMFRKGDREATWFENRSYYAHDLTVGTVPLRWFWLYSDGIGIVSQPSVYPDSNGNGEVDPADENYGYGYGGWGLDPLALRPDGEDPDRLDDLQARDWLAAVSLKTATTRDGVPIHTYNHNRCDEGAWEGPYDDGTWRCTSMHLPDLGFQNDVWNLWVTSEFLQAYPIPVTTLGGTGLPDPDIPGGVVPQIAGTPTLADADWDACSWPATFLPDKAPMEDTPGDWGGPASLLADTWRFDKPSDLDLRLLLSTVQPRGYCGGEVP
ncbi:MAG TPA: hypothetical protein PKA64_16075, partial [Myxococcota bacterium]|nr:hypothetical protein [Myxococcota bacterium]